MKNISKISKGHNKKVTSKPQDQTPKCNCRKKTECPMEGNCQVNDVVYKWDVTRALPKKCIFDLKKENVRAVSTTASYNNLSTRNIPIWQHFQLTCGTWKLFQVKHLKSGLFTILKYLEEIHLVLIWKNGNSYLTKSGGTPEKEIWTLL